MHSKSGESNSIGYIQENVITSSAQLLWVLLLELRTSLPTLPYSSSHYDSNNFCSFWSMLLWEWQLVNECSSDCTVGRRMIKKARCTTEERMYEGSGGCTISFCIQLHICEEGDKFPAMCLRVRWWSEAPAGLLLYLLHHQPNNGVNLMVCGVVLHNFIISNFSCLPHYYYTE